MKLEKTLGQCIAEALDEDLADRRGFRAVLESMLFDDRNDLRNDWAQMIDRILDCESKEEEAKPISPKDLTEPPLSEATIRTLNRIIQKTFEESDGHFPLIIKGDNQDMAFYSIQKAYEAVGWSVTSRIAEAPEDSCAFDIEYVFTPQED